MRIRYVFLAVLLMLTTHVSTPLRSFAQEVQDSTILLAKGRSLLLTTRSPAQRVAVSNPDIVDAVVVSQREVILNAKEYGATSLIIWTSAIQPSIYSIEVTPDAGVLERDLKRFFPGDSIAVTARGKTLVLSGRVRSAETSARAVAFAQASGLTIIDYLVPASSEQILLSVQIAEVSRSAIKEFDAQFRVLNAKDLTGAGDQTIESVSEGVLRYFLLDAGAQLDATIRWLKTQGQFKTLAEPNLLTMPGKEASFLAGGEFPYPVVRGAGENQSISIVFREFGIRLAFTPVITNAGTIRLKVTPEVSALDFANGLRLGGFSVPSLLTRKAQTEVELRPGQFLAIAGLNNSDTRKVVSKFPILGDIPLLGLLFRNTDTRQSRDELLIIVTPRIVQPSDTAPTLPTGDIETWEWDGTVYKPLKKSNPK